jgi:hypothetical protein
MDQSSKFGASAVMILLRESGCKGPKACTSNLLDGKSNSYEHKAAEQEMPGNQ